MKNDTQIARSLRLQAFTVTAKLRGLVALLSQSEAIRLITYRTVSACVVNEQSTINIFRKVDYASNHRQLYQMDTRSQSLDKFVLKSQPEALQQDKFDFSLTQVRYGVVAQSGGLADSDKGQQVKQHWHLIKRLYMLLH